MMLLTYVGAPFNSQGTGQPHKRVLSTVQFLWLEVAHSSVILDTDLCIQGWPGREGHACNDRPRLFQEES